MSIEDKKIGLIYVAVGSLLFAGVLLCYWNGVFI